MTKFMAGLKIKYKFWIVVGIALFCLILTEIIFLIHLKQDLFEEKKIRTRNVVETAYEIIQFHYNAAKSGTMTEDEAQQKSKDLIRSLRYEGNEYFWINNMQAFMVAHPYFELEGKDQSELKDVKGKKIIVSFIEKVRTHNSGFVEYFWKKPNAEKHTPKIAYVKGFEPWGWIIGTGVYTDDIDVIFFNKAMRMAIIMVVLTFIVVTASWFVARSITQPLSFVKKSLQQVAEGDLRIDNIEDNIFSYGSDEVGQILIALNNMRSNLDSLIGQVQLSGIQVTSSTTQIAASARQLESTVAEQAASIREVTFVTKKISGTSEDLMKTMGGVSDTASNTAGMAEEGRASLNRMQSSMRSFIEATGYISSKLGIINEKANKISGVVTTINKISDQTNLLSLNAAIEAEKAGEYGKGFSVVAREITRLSDQTAIATKDIEYMVKEMQSSVTSGVMEMDKFAEGVRKNVEAVEAIGDQLADIIDQVRKLGPQFQMVNEGMHTQVDGAQQISEAMKQLSTTADHTRESLVEFKGVTEQLNSAVQVLQNEVSRFKLNRG